jgi:hypothetical protein
MTEQREAVPTVGLIDEYCQDYRSLFADVRSFEAFKFVHVGMLSAIPRKSQYITECPNTWAIPSSGTP